MSGHVAPWCIGCGCPDHDPVLFDESGDLIFDDDAFDLAVVEARLNPTLDRTQLAEVLEVHEKSIFHLVAVGRIPAPALPTSRRGHYSLWTARQAASMVVFGGVKRGPGGRPKRTAVPA